MPSECYLLKGSVGKYYTEPSESPAVLLVTYNFPANSAEPNSVAGDMALKGRYKLLEVSQSVIVVYSHEVVFPHNPATLKACLG